MSSYCEACAAMRTDDMCPACEEYIERGEHCTRVFVYGTLMRGFGLHRVLAHEQFLGNATLRGYRLFDLGPFPGIRLDPGGAGLIHGEVYEVSPETFATLDRVEGEGSLYKRTRVFVERRPTLAQRTREACATYVYLGSDGLLLPSGTRWGD